MKKSNPVYFLILWIVPAILITGFAGCNNHRNAQIRSEKIAAADTSLHMPVISFDQKALDLGKLAEGETAGAEFTFRNTGTGNLQIKDIQASCGCTLVQWERKVIPPGDESAVKVLFNTKGFNGLQNKSIRVISNAANNEVILALTAEVIPGTP